MSKPLTIKRHRSESFRLKADLNKPISNIRASHEDKISSTSKYRYAKIHDPLPWYDNTKTKASYTVAKNILKEESPNLTTKIKEGSFRAYRLRKSSCFKKALFEKKQIQNIWSYQATYREAQPRHQTQRIFFNQDRIKVLGLQELFYNQVKFLQKCKAKARQIK